MGQFGLGTTVTGELSRPRLHAWFESATAGGTLGEAEGSGIECISAGGMHTLAIDELGRVSRSQMIVYNNVLM
jgi:regulator of chromosome condensation